LRFALTDSTECGFGQEFRGAAMWLEGGCLVNHQILPLISFHSSSPGIESEPGSFCSRSVFTRLRRGVKFEKVHDSKGEAVQEKLKYEVTRGKKAGVALTPHMYSDGYFRAYKTNSRNDPEGRRVKTERELIDLVRSGYHVRMSNLERGHSPSTVKPEIVIE
jgi:hypothetical protein